MSSLILSNPYVTPSTPTPPSQENSSAALALAPVAAKPSADKSGQSTSFDGSGTGSGRQGDTVALLMHRSEKAQPPADATKASVVNAQAENFPFSLNLPEVKMPDPLPTSPFLKRR